MGEIDAIQSSQHISIAWQLPANKPGHPQRGWGMGAAVGWLPKPLPAGILLDSVTKGWMAQPQVQEQ